jgi:transcription elongation factor GreA-like protein
MTKKEALQNAIDEGNEYGYISWDGLLDLCDEDMVIGRYLIKELKKMKDANVINFDISEIV